MKPTLVEGNLVNTLLDEARKEYRLKKYQNLAARFDDPNAHLNTTELDDLTAEMEHTKLDDDSNEHSESVPESSPIDSSPSNRGTPL